MGVVVALVCCGCQQQPKPVAEVQLAADAPVQPPAPPKADPPKPTTLVIRSVKPAGSAAITTGFVSSYGLTRDDLNQLTAVPGVVELVPARHLPTKVAYQDRPADTRVVATAPGFAGVSELKVSSGRFLTDADDTNMENSCVLGSALAKKLFPKEDPLGQTVGMHGHSFKVVGVLEEKAGPGEANNDVYIPLRVSYRRFGNIISFKIDDKERVNEKVDLHEIIIRVADPDKLPAVTDAVRAMLEKSHPAKDWEITTR
jgi:putative ABC transport system permease protein